MKNLSESKLGVWIGMPVIVLLSLTGSSSCAATVKADSPQKQESPSEDVASTPDPGTGALVETPALSTEVVEPLWTLKECWAIACSNLVGPLSSFCPAHSIQRPEPDNPAAAINHFGDATCAEASCGAFAVSGLHCFRHGLKAWTPAPAAQCAQLWCNDPVRTGESHCAVHAGTSFTFTPAGCALVNCHKLSNLSGPYCDEHALYWSYQNAESPSEQAAPKWGYECSNPFCQTRIFFGSHCDLHQEPPVLPEVAPVARTTRWSARISVATREAYRVMGLGDLGSFKERTSFPGSSCVVEIDAESKKIIVDLWGRHEFPTNRAQARLPHSDGGPSESATGDVLSYWFDDDSFQVDVEFDVDVHDEWDAIGPSYRGTISGRFKIDGNRSGDRWDAKVNIAYKHYHSLSALGSSGGTSTIVAVQLGETALSPIQD